MTAVPISKDDRRLAHARLAPVQTNARIAGVLLLISAVAGGFGEFFVPSHLIVSGDATATANNIIASDLLFRMGFASYLVETLCDVSLTLILYVLLRPVRRVSPYSPRSCASCPPPRSPSASSSMSHRRSSWEALTI